MALASPAGSRRSYRVGGCHVAVRGGSADLGRRLGTGAQLGPVDRSSGSGRRPAPRRTGCWRASLARRWRPAISRSTRAPSGGRPTREPRRCGSPPSTRWSPSPTGCRLATGRWFWWPPWWAALERAGGLRRKRVDMERGTVTVAEQLLEVNGTFSVGSPKSAATARSDGPARAFDHRGSGALSARHGRPGRGHRPAAEPADRGRLTSVMPLGGSCEPDTRWEGSASIAAALRCLRVRRSAARRPAWCQRCDVAPGWPRRCRG